jgi:hypothetical protein
MREDFWGLKWRREDYGTTIYREIDYEIQCYNGIPPDGPLCLLHLSNTWLQTIKQQEFKMRRRLEIHGSFCSATRAMHL